MSPRHVRLVLDRRPTYSIIASPPATLGVSFVVPVKDEAESIAALAAEITTAMTAAPWLWECVWVDDGSTDGTGQVLQHVACEDPRHRVLSLPRNVGQSAALAAGLSAASGELLVTLDGDGENDPRQAPAMILMLIRSRADMVNGWRQPRGDGLLRRVSSRAGNRLRRWITGDEVRDFGCSLRVFRRAVVQGLFVFRGLHRFLPTLARLNGATRILEVPVRHRPRRRQTRFRLRDRLWAGLADAFAIRWLLARAVSAGAPRLRPARGVDQDRA
jgi:glycosyltransferase involved in cell wall biosynthesis